MANCPICGREFSAENVRGLPVSTCANCDGVWMTAGDFERIVGDDVANDLGEWTQEPTECRHCRRPLGFSNECVGCGKISVVQCPMGHGRMSAVLVEIGGAEIEIDRCPSCRGVWIDSHEREAVEHGVPAAPVRKLPAREKPPSAGGEEVAMVAMEALAWLATDTRHRRRGFFGLVGRGRHRRGPQAPSGILIAVGLILLILYGLTSLVGGALSLP